MLALITSHHIHWLLDQIEIEILIAKAGREIEVSIHELLAAGIEKCVDIRLVPTQNCYFYDLFLGGETSSDLPLYITIEVRLSLHLAMSSHSVVHAAFACALSSHKEVQVNQRGFKQTRS